MRQMLALLFNGLVPPNKWQGSNDLARISMVSIMPKLSRPGLPCTSCRRISVKCQSAALRSVFAHHPIDQQYLSRVFGMPLCFFRR